LNEVRLFVVSDVPEPEDQPQVVFDHWVTVLREGRPGPRPVFSGKRRRLVERALEMYGLDTCRSAVDGCALSDWHMGHNPQGRRYDSLELIFRGPEQIERFANIAHEAHGGGDFDTLTEVDW
jgi:hypothetical protein